MIKPIAVVTGASSGFGAIYAEKLANLGYNLILVARRENLMQNLADKICGSLHTDIRIIKKDLSKLSEIKDLAIQLELEKDIEILVNNAGFGTVGRFYRQDPEKPEAMLTLHVHAPTILSRAVLPSMVTRNKGYIINVSSLAAFLTTTGNVTYSATKAYLNTFSLILAGELKNKNISIQSLCPGFTHTDMLNTPEYKSRDIDESSVPGWMWMDAEPVVDYSLKKMHSGRVIIIPGIRYKILKAIMTSKILNPLVKLLLSQHR